MSPRAKAKRTIWRQLSLGFALVLLFSIPAFLCAIKSIYANRVMFFSEIVAAIYRSSPSIQNLWEWRAFPAFQPSSGFSIGNVFAILFPAAAMIGIFNLAAGWGNLVRYRELKRQAEDSALRDDFLR